MDFLQSENERKTLIALITQLLVKDKDELTASEAELLQLLIIHILHVKL